MSSKAKRVLPTRPEPPSVEQILADVRGTHPADPVFLLPAEPLQDHSPSPGEERLYQQSRSYVEMNQRLQESRERLREQCEELRRAGAALERGISEMRQKAF
uniref:Chromosome 19 open reading frame 25 n=1 Tax=Accipiter nisus TaxID=211598 RepID=A0A8B9MGU1_9AVES